MRLNICFYELSVIFEAMHRLERDWRERLSLQSSNDYGVATIRRLLKIIGDA